MNRKEFLTKIKSNIKNTGQHITIVSGHQVPRYAYTIGLLERLNIELIFAGGIFYLEQDVRKILNGIAKMIDKGSGFNSTFNLDSLGEFRLSNVHSSWSEIMILGVYDYYNAKEVNAYQVLPAKNNFTLDIPNMTKIWLSTEQPAWMWLTEDWVYDVSEKVTVVTDLDTLKGNPITEIMRWEKEEWEMFSGPSTEFDEKAIRVVPIGLLLSIDSSLLPALELNIGKGMWRKGISDNWKDWG